MNTNPTRVIAVAATGSIATFEAALALGAPWGAVAFGGRHSGVLPGHLRWTAAGASLAWGAVATTAWRTRGAPEPTTADGASRRGAGERACGAPEPRLTVTS